MHRLSSILLVLVVGLSAQAQIKRYGFCVQSENYERFKIEVEFNGVDMGAYSAKYLAKKYLSQQLEGEIQLVNFYSSAKCGCEEQCKTVLIQAEKVNGQIELSEGDSGGNVPVAAIGTIDRIVRQAREVASNPQESLKKALSEGLRFFGKILN